MNRKSGGLSDECVRASVEAGYYARVIDAWLSSQSMRPRMAELMRRKGVDIGRTDVLQMQEWALNRGMPESQLLLPEAMREILQSPNFIEFARNLQRAHDRYSGRTTSKRQGKGTNNETK